MSDILYSIQSLYKEFIDSDGIITDSRKARKNTLFFALKGENFNGNKFARQAIENGCKLAIVDEKQYAGGPSTLLVNDVLKTLQELAKFHRQHISAKIIGITGTNGKTTTKELIHSVLSAKYFTLATKGNLNNHIGVPLTLLDIKNEELAIIEMGANHQGEIALLANISAPDYGLITNIGKAHLEGFGSFEGVVKTKSELFQAVQQKKGTLFLNADNPILQQIASLFPGDQVFYGNTNNSLCEGIIKESSETLLLDILFKKSNRRHSVRINLSGRYNLENILAAVCIGIYFGVEEKKIIQGLEKYKGGQNRSQYLNTLSNKLILDAYNANPTSMKESLNNFLAQKNQNKVLILGDMLELGEYSKSEHKNILDGLVKYPGIKIFLVGKEFYRFKDAYQFNFFKQTTELSQYFLNSPVKDSYILLKGSRGIALEKLISFL